MPIHWPYTNNQHLNPLPGAEASTPHFTPKYPPKSFIERTLKQKYTGGRGAAAAALLLLLLTLNLHAQTPLDPTLAITTIPLYPNTVPNAKGTAPADTPTLSLFRPNHPNGTAVIIDPGGAYLNLAAIHEGRQEADRLTEAGVTAFVLKYRLGPTYLYPVPLDDARRAIRLVRSLATTYGYSPNRIGMMGFSAGGHLAATAATLPTPIGPDPGDPVDHQPSDLNFLILIYPWLNAMQPPVPNPYQPGSKYINYCSVTKGLTQADCARLNSQYTPTDHITAATPPTFLAATADDNVVPVTVSVDFFTAMHRANADAELHIFHHGPHGFGTGVDQPELGIWQDLLLTWLRTHNLLTPPTPSTH